MLDPVYYLVSAVMWFWQQAFGLLLGPASGVAWALSVVFLVLTLRAVMIRPFLAQLRSGRAMRALAPQLAQLRARHADDPVRLLTETRALQASHGVRPLATILPMLLQLPVLLGLLHVLQHFNRRGLTFEQNAAIPNYVFGPDEVRSFLEARLFGAPLSSYLSMPQDLLDSFGVHVDRWEVALVAVPLIALAAIATHVTARHSLRQQPAEGPAAAILRWSPWIFPLGALIGGVFFPFPIAILLYWLTNSVWTLGQQWIVFRTPQPVPLGVPPLAVASAPPTEPRAVARGGSASARPRRNSSGHRPARRRSRRKPA